MWPAKYWISSALSALKMPSFSIISIQRIDSSYYQSQWPSTLMDECGLKYAFIFLKNDIYRKGIIHYMLFVLPCSWPLCIMQYSHDMFWWSRTQWSRRCGVSCGTILDLVNAILDRPETPEYGECADLFEWEASCGKERWWFWKCWMQLRGQWHADISKSRPGWSISSR